MKDFPQFCLAQFQQDASNLQITTTDHYIASYPHFLSYFSNRNYLTEHAVIIAGHFVYGWMPTLVTMDLFEIDKVVTILNKVKNKQELELSDYLLLKTCLNNSIVGISKLLHFINPDQYAMWDSHICNYLMGAKHQYKVNNVQVYISYLNNIRELATNSELQYLIEKVNDKLPYKVTSLRALELVMFITDKENNHRT